MASVCPPPRRRVQRRVPPSVPAAQQLPHRARARARAVRAAVARAAQPPSLAAEALSVALPPPRAALSATAHRCAE